MERLNVCAICAQKFSRRDSLLRHNHIHRKDKRFKCVKCYHEFGRRDHLNRHYRIHFEEKPIVASTQRMQQSERIAQNPLINVRSEPTKQLHLVDPIACQPTHHVTYQNDEKLKEALKEFEFL